jgi:hypothetical protein
MVPRVRRSDPVAARSPARHAAGRGQFHHEVVEGRARCSRVTGADGGHVRGRDAWRTDDVCAHRRHAGIEPERRPRGGKDLAISRMKAPNVCQI